MAKAILYDKKYFTKRDSLDPKIASAAENLTSQGKALDVGCGTGKLVDYLNKKGFDAYGCDPYASIKKNKIFTKALASKLPYKSDTFNLVTCVSVIEHLKKREANKFLSEANRVLKDQGYIFLVTPNYNSIWRRILGKKWFGYSDPTHIIFYTPATLSKLLKKHGFKRIKFYFKTENLNFIDFLLVSTPFWRIRDSFYVAAQK